VPITRVAGGGPLQSCKIRINSIAKKECSLSIRPGRKRKGTSRIASRLETLPITLWSRVLQTNIILRTKGTITKINIATFFKKSKATKISG
jgi:hypothetical protein